MAQADFGCWGVRAWLIRWLARGLLESEADPHSAPDRGAGIAFVSVRNRRPAPPRSAVRLGQVLPAFRWRRPRTGRYNGSKFHAPPGSRCPVDETRSADRHPDSPDSNGA